MPVDGLFNHYFSVDGEEYEFVDGLFFKKVCVMPAGKSFGEIALQRRCLRTATIKSESVCEFAYLTKESYENSLF